MFPLYKMVLDHYITQLSVLVQCFQKQPDSSCNVPYTSLDISLSRSAEVYSWYPSLCQKKTSRLDL